MRIQRLLVVEDDPTWRDRLGEAALKEGCDVTLASDGLEALSQLNDSARPPPELVLLDLLMPHLDGWGLYGRMRSDAALRRIPILMMSMAQGRDIDLGGVVGFLHKAPSPEPTLTELRQRLRQPTPPSFKAEAVTAYALRLTEECTLTLNTLPTPLRHAVQMHLHRAAELAGTELPMMSTWLLALPGTPPSLLVTVQGVRVVLEVDDAARTLTTSTFIIPPHLPLS
ncbi:response regulator [Hyalangium rubrum]|uniref:Response regulator n=1 Tax=Hyalangium rubrum TaxID=3103134 RepID=A0ABU5H961_9BACT|nr:response regulator [Hyalangium sp. s54d21]MDY7230028.1 response regulator [Hyalangium sp. s54d21]